MWPIGGDKSEVNEPCRKDNSSGEFFPPFIIAAVVAGMGSTISVERGNAQPIANPDGEATHNYLESAEKSFYPAMRDNCVESANDSLRSQGLNPGKPRMAQAVTTACDCIVNQTKTKLTKSEFAAILKDQTAQPAGTKIAESTASCLKALYERPL